VTNPNWTNLNGIFTATNGTATALDSGVAMALFYRVVLLPNLGLDGNDPMATIPIIWGRS
jgi:hypothetical protein